MCLIPTSLLGSIWLDGWKSGRIENGEGIENWEDRRDLVFSYVFGWENKKVERWKMKLV